MGLLLQDMQFLQLKNAVKDSIESNTLSSRHIQQADFALS